MRGPQTEALRRSLHLSIDPSPYHKDSTNGHPSSAESAASPITSTRASVATTSHQSHMSMLTSEDGNEWRICTVLCLYDFRSEDQDHLSFKKGDILDIVTQEDTGWWAAMRRGGSRVGWIPGSFVQPLAEDTAKTWANVEKELQIWSPDAPQLWRRSTVRRNSEFTLAESQTASQYDGDADEEIDFSQAHRIAQHSLDTPRSDWTHMANPASPESMYNIDSPGPPPPNLRPTPFYNKPTPPTPISPNPQPVATSIISNLYSGPRKQPIFTTPGAVQGPVRAESLAPVAEASGQSTVTDEEILINRSGKPEKIRQLTGDDAAITAGPNRQIQPSQPWYIRPQYADNELKLEVDGSIKMGTLRALIEQLTGEFTIPLLDKSFRHEFFLTFRTFATAEEIFSMIIARYELPPPDGIAIAEIDDWRERKLRPIQNRVLMCLTAWLEDHNMLNEDPHIAQPMSEFLSLIAQPPPLALAARLILNTLKRLTFAGPPVTTPITSPSSRTKRKKVNKNDLLRMDSAVIAQQLTLLEHKLYLRITPQECLNWAKVQTGRMVVHMQAFSGTHDKIAKWVKSSILSNDGLGKRADTVDFWIKVAEKCRTFNNYSSMSAIVAGLASTVVSRLHLTWAHVGRAAHLDPLTKLVDPAGNFSQWRSLLASIEGPCVPFIGMYLTDIVHINDQYPDVQLGLPNLPLIHFLKRSKWAEAVTSITRFQSKSYFLAEDPIVMAYIEQQLGIAMTKDQNGFWTRSQELQQAELAHADIRKGLEAAGF